MWVEKSKALGKWWLVMYEKWSQGIADYFTRGVPSGSMVFLALNDNAIADIGEGLLGLEAADCKESFLSSLRAEASANGAEIFQETLGGHLGSGVPKCTAFLAGMVYGIHQMRADEEVGLNNYWVRFREVFGISAGKGRPPGMIKGSGEEFWIGWNEWLLAKGFEPSAHRGNGPLTYIRYPLSQAVLREDDKGYMARKFGEVVTSTRLSPFSDREQVAVWLRSAPTVNRKHLKKGFRHPDPMRAGAFYDSAFEVFATQAFDDQLEGVAQALGRRVIEAGIVESEDFFTGERSILMLPRIPRLGGNEALRVNLDDGLEEELKVMREGLYCPLPIQGDRGIFQRREFEVQGSSLIERMVFPEKDFWILFRDPSGLSEELATWNTYPDLLANPGFSILLPKDSHLIEMLHEILHRDGDERLLDWTEEREGDGYVAFDGCMILSANWGAVIPDDESVQLFEALRPRSKAAVKFSGGLQMPGRRTTYIEGHPPNLRLYGFEEEFELVILNGEGEEVVRQRCPRQVDISLADLGVSEPDSYECRINWQFQKNLSSRRLRIAGWKEVDFS